MSSDKRVFILDAEFSNSLDFLRYFRSEGYDVFLASPGAVYETLLSRYRKTKIKLPESGYLEDYGKGVLRTEKKIKEFILCLKKKLRRYRTDKIVPLTEGTLIPVSKYRSKLPIADILPEHSAIINIHDKLLCQKKLSEFSPSEFSLPKVFESDLKFPCVARPRKGVGSYYTYLCRDEESRQEAQRKIKDVDRKPFIQEYIPPDSKGCINLFVDREGEIKKAVSMLNVDEERVRRILDELEQFFGDIEYFGFASPQFIVRGKEIFLFEINPRLSYYYYGLDFGVGLVMAFEKNILSGEEVRKGFQFIRNPDSFLKASFSYFMGTKDPLPVLKSMFSFSRIGLWNMVRQRESGLKKL